MHADGKGGNDLMEGSDFNDTLIGGDGYDHIDTQEGKKNKATGGKGKDWFFVDSEDLEDSHVTITDFNRKQKDKIAWADDRSDYNFKTQFKKVIRSSWPEMTTTNHTQKSQQSRGTKSIQKKISSMTMMTIGMPPATSEVWIPVRQTNQCETSTLPTLESC